MTNRYRFVEDHYLNAPGNNCYECMITNVRYLRYKKSWLDYFEGQDNYLAGLAVNFTAYARRDRDDMLKNLDLRYGTSATTGWSWTNYTMDIDIFNKNHYINDQKMKFLHSLASAVHARGMYNVDANDPIVMMQAYQQRLTDARLNLFDLHVTCKTSKKGKAYLTYEAVPAGSESHYYLSDLFANHPNFGLKKTRLGNGIHEIVTPLRVAEATGRASGLPGFYHIRDNGKKFDIYEYNDELFTLN